MRKQRHLSLSWKPFRRFVPRFIPALAGDMATETFSRSREVGLDLSFGGHRVSFHLVSTNPSPFPSPTEPSRGPLPDQVHV